MFLMLTAARIAKVLFYVIPANARIPIFVKFIVLSLHQRTVRFGPGFLPSPPLRGRGKGEGVICALIFTFLFIAHPVLGAPAPDLEDRTREIASELRCVVCQNLSVADSPSEMAQQMRGIVREQLKAGKSPEEIKDFFVSKYGEWVLLKPKTTGFSALLWILPYVVLVLGVAAGLWFIRRWVVKTKTSSAKPPQSLAKAGANSTLLKRDFEQPDLEDTSERAELLREQARLKDELGELDFDFQSGKLSDSDYAELQQEVESKSAAVIQRLISLPAKPVVRKTTEKTTRTIDQRSLRELTRSRRWQLVGGGIFLLLFGLVLGVMLTKSVRPREGEDDSMTGDFLTGTSPANSESRAALQEGKQAFARQEFPKAIEAFKKVLAADPNNPEAHSYMGFILVQAGHGDGALLAFDKALSQAPNFPMALWGKGMVLYREKQDFVGARQTLEKLLNLVPPGEERNEIAKVIAEIPSGGGRKSQSPSQTTAAATPSAQISGRISLDPKLKANLDPNAALFIIARPAGAAGGPPLAVKKIDKPVFPLSYSLGQENVMMQGAAFTGKINLTVRLDKDGNPTTRGAGDLTGDYKKNPVEVGTKNVDVVIDLVAR
jgi:cytochrome c-type biogenesis protein CcmH